MSIILKSLAKWALLFAIGFFVVGPLVTKVARADDTAPNIVPGAPFGFRCEGPTLDMVAEGCAGKLMEKCNGQLVIEAVRSTPKDEMPAVVEGIARCTVQESI